MVYSVNGRSFIVFDGSKKFNEIQFELGPYFFNIFVEGFKIDSTNFTEEKEKALVQFVEQTGSLGRDVKSHLYGAAKHSEKT